MPRPAQWSDEEITSVQHLCVENAASCQAILETLAEVLAEMNQQDVQKTYDRLFAKRQKYIQSIASRYLSTPPDEF